MKRAFHELRDEGWLIVQHGRNTRVATALPVASSRDELLAQARNVLAEVTRLVRAIEAMPA